MKSIKAVTIWDKGTSKQASILDAHAINVTLNTSATFYYALLSANEDGLQSEVLTQGNLSMINEDYAQWVIDQDAWDYIAKSLNLVITGDYVSPIIENSELS
jgi:hypothetical protein